MAAKRFAFLGDEFFEARPAHTPSPWVAPGYVALLRGSGRTACAARSPMFGDGAGEGPGPGGVTGCGWTFKGSLLADTRGWGR